MPLERDRNFSSGLGKGIRVQFDTELVMENIKHQFFVEALDTRGHPIKKAKMGIQAEYITALTYVVEKVISEVNCYRAEIEKCVGERLRVYRDKLFANIPITDVSCKTEISCLSSFKGPGRKRFRFMLICDLALIILDKSLILRATEIIKKGLSAKRQDEVEQLATLLQNNQKVEKKYLPALPLLNQYRVNKYFLLKKERRIIVTANMSAGKSTLINAIIGKPIARTSQEVCTGNVCYLFNKAYEDRNIHLLTQKLNFSATADDLRDYDWNGQIYIASYFAGIASNIPRLCIIDTPGVDAALYKEHSRRAHDVLLHDNYDVILYVVSPNRLGTAAEMKHLQWVARNLNKEKIIFILNKIDNYHDFSDSIEESVYKFKDDLLKIGFENPVICPISAYFSYLIKLRMTGQALSEDEADEYALYSKKFMRPSYDLSRYYEYVQCLPTDSEEIALSKRAGLYGLEKIICGDGL